MKLIAKGHRGNDGDLDTIIKFDQYLYEDGGKFYQEKKYLRRNEDKWKKIPLLTRIRIFFWGPSPPGMEVVSHTNSWRISADDAYQFMVQWGYSLDEAAEKTQR